MERKDAENLGRTIIAEAGEILTSTGEHDADGIRYESRAVNVLDMYEELTTSGHRVPADVEQAYDDVCMWL